MTTNPWGHHMEGRVHVLFWDATEGRFGSARASQARYIGTWATDEDLVIGDLVVPVDEWLHRDDHTIVDLGRVMARGNEFEGSLHEQKVRKATDDDLARLGYPH